MATNNKRFVDQQKNKDGCKRVRSISGSNEFALISNTLVLSEHHDEKCNDGESSWFCSTSHVLICHCLCIQCIEKQRAFHHLFKMLHVYFSEEMRKLERLGQNQNAACTNVEEYNKLHPADSRPTRWHWCDSCSDKSMRPDMKPLLLHCIQTVQTVYFDFIKTICQLAFENGAQVFGGVVRQLLLPEALHAEKLRRLDQILRDDVFGLAGIHCIFSIGGIRNMILGYYGNSWSSYVIPLQQWPTDIDIWFQLDSVTTINGMRIHPQISSFHESLQQRFTVESTDPRGNMMNARLMCRDFEYPFHKTSLFVVDRSPSSVDEIKHDDNQQKQEEQQEHLETKFPLYDYFASRKVDIVVSPRFPVNDFSCNLISFDGVQFRAQTSLNNSDPRFDLQAIIEHIVSKKLHILTEFALNPVGNNIRFGRHETPRNLVDGKFHRHCMCTKGPGSFRVCRFARVARFVQQYGYQMQKPVLQVVGTHDEFNFWEHFDATTGALNCRWNKDDEKWEPELSSSV